ncbi:hypothetical protein RB195_020834 [Necator americanus]|uniref:Uncharacterized protein n=1 Tax=Necator americanus TaxID=51031 RepID=A0ABR1CKR2_NECAM
MLMESNELESNLQLRKEGKKMQLMRAIVGLDGLSGVDISPTLIATLWLYGAASSAATYATASAQCDVLSQP